MAHRRRIGRHTIRRSKERQYLRSLRDAWYDFDCRRHDRKEAPGLLTTFADIGVAWYNLLSSRRSDTIMVGKAMLPRGRKVRLSEWRELNERGTVRFLPVTEAVLVRTRDEIREDDLFFSREDTLRAREGLSSGGGAREERLEPIQEVRSIAERQREELDPPAAVFVEEEEEEEEEERMRLSPLPENVSSSQGEATGAEFALSKRWKGWLKEREECRQRKEEWEQLKENIRWCVETADAHQELRACRARAEVGVGSC